MGKSIVEVSRPEGLSFFVGDIHGQYELLMQKLKEVGFDPDKGHTLFSVGDLIDRGPESMKCLKLIDKPWFKAVRGNHEDLMIKTVLHNCHQSENIWARNGGAWAGAYYKEDSEKYRFEDELVEYAKKLDSLPYLREIATHISKQKIAVVHAEIPASINYDALKEIKKNDQTNGRVIDSLIWQRTLADQLSKKDIIYESDDCCFLKSRKHFNHPNKSHIADVVVSGHTPMHRPVLVKRNLFIDTGAARGSKLTILNEIEIKNILKLYKGLKREQKLEFR